jgi:hypothetical protein
MLIFARMMTVVLPEVPFLPLLLILNLCEHPWGFLSVLHPLLPLLLREG